MALLRKLFSSKVFVIFAALLLLFALIIATAPARLITGALQKAVPSLQLSPGEGTLWKGHCEQATAIVNGFPLDLGRLDWHFKAWSLLLLKPQLSLSTDAEVQSLKANLAVSLLGSAELKPLRGKISLTTLRQFAPIPADGLIKFDFSKVKIGKKGRLAEGLDVKALQGVVDLKSMVWLAGDNDMPLGDYKARVNWENNAVKIVLKDDQANLGVDGNITADLAGAYALDAQLTPRDNLAEEIKNSLQFLGRPNRDGHYQIKRDGRWRQ